MAKQINLGERLFLLANRVLSNGSQETLGNKSGITNNTATDQSIPTTKAVKEYVDSKIYNHPTHTAYIGQPTGNQAPDFGGEANVSQFEIDSLGHVTKKTDRTITIPSTKAQPIIKNSSGTVTSRGTDGLMSIADKTKLDQIKSLEWTEVALQTGGNDWIQSGSYNKDNARISYNDYIAILELNFDSDYVNQHSQINLAAQYWWELGKLPDGVPKPLAPVGVVNTYGYVKRSYIKITKSGSVALWSPEQINKLGIEGTLMWRVSK